MSAGALGGEIIVPFFGAMLFLTPVITRPTVPFGVRVPAERARATVIRHERYAYAWRTAAIGVCCTVAALLLWDHGSWWLTRVIALLEVAADLGCFWIARRKVAAVKHAEDWYAGHRQVVATDTTWRTDPPRFPVRWLVPALTVIAVTVIVGVLRYPDLPARVAVGWGTSGHRVPKSVVSVFGFVIGQVYATALWTGLMLLIYRSRPDIEATDAAASTDRYRRFLAAWTRAFLTLIALVDLTLLLIALRDWQVYRLSGPGSALPLLPLVIGLAILMAVIVRTGQGGFRLARGRPGGTGGTGATGGAGGTGGTGTDRDDDRFWKAGLIYANRDDPAIMVGARFGVGWTFNFANPVAWLVLAGLVTVPAGLAAIIIATGR